MWWMVYAGSLYKSMMLMAHMLGLRGSNPTGAWISVSIKCYVLSCRGLLVGLITRLEESYRVWCV